MKEKWEVRMRKKNKQRISKIKGKEKRKNEILRKKGRNKEGGGRKK